MNDSIKELLSIIQDSTGEEASMALKNSIEDGFNDFELSAMKIYYKTEESLNDLAIALRNWVKFNVPYDGLPKGETNAVYTLYPAENQNSYNLKEYYVLTSSKDPSFVNEVLTDYEGSNELEFDQDDFSVIVTEYSKVEEGSISREYTLHIYIPVGDDSDE